jgi:hypothetical protein
MSASWISTRSMAGLRHLPIEIGRIETLRTTFRLLAARAMT